MKSLIKRDLVTDAMDTAIINVLSLNARLSIKALSRQVGLSAPSCSERLRRLERLGVIRGYRVELNPETLGCALSILVRIKAFSGQFERVERWLSERSEFITVYKVTGDDDFIGVAQLRTVAQLDQLLQPLVSIASTHTSLIKTECHSLPSFG